MAGPLAKMYATLGLDAGDFDKGLSRSEGKLGQFGTSVKAGFGLGAGFGAFSLLEKGIGSALDLMGDAVDMASDWEESNSKVGVVFGTLAGDIRTFAGSASTSMGMSERAALDALGTFGNFTQALGLSEAASVDMSKAMVQLAADMGSFNNVASDEVLLALRSGLSGEAEPLKRFGVALSAAAVDAELLASGATKVGKEWSEAQKITARYEIIMRQTATAQGDFLRTGDGFANTMKTINSQLEEAQTEIGKALLPVIRDLAIFTRDSLVPVIVDASKSLAGLGDVVKDFYSLVQPAAARDNAVRDMATGLRDEWDLTDQELQRLTFHLTNADKTLADMGWDAAARDAELYRQALFQIGPAIERRFEQVGKAAAGQFGAIGPAVTRAMVGLEGSVTEPLVDEFADARKAALAGFGRLKDVFRDAPTEMTGTQRLDQMRKRRTGILRELRRAHDREDPAAVSYWQKALAKSETRLEVFSGKVGREWQGYSRVVRQESTDAADRAIEQAQRIERKLGAVDLFDEGAGMMQSWVRGIESVMPAVDATRARLAAPVPTLAGGGGGIVQHFHIGAVYGGDAGLRELGRKIERATELGLRERRWAGLSD